MKRFTKDVIIVGAMVGLLVLLGSKVAKAEAAIPVITLNFDTVQIEQPDTMVEACLLNHAIVYVAPCSQVAADYSGAMKEANPTAEIRIIVNGQNWSAV